MENDKKTIFDDLDLDLDLDIDEQEIRIAPFLFKMTSLVAPEQYDVYYKEDLCAYVRLRHGKLSCDVPWCGGETVYTHNFEDERGGFYDDEETLFYLDKIAAVLREIWDVA